MIKRKLKELEITEKILYSLFIALFFLILIFSLLGLNKILFLLLSLADNLFLIFIFRYIKKKLDIKFNKFQKILIFVMILVIYAFYLVSILKRNFIYYWDYSCYYNLQLSTKSYFDNGLLMGIKSFIASTWSGEYGNFISFFPEFIFNFTNKSINSYVLSCVIIFVPYIVFSLTIFLKYIMKIFKIKKENIFISVSLVSFLLSPILHAMFIYGQPDLFGLTFVFLIISLTVGYDFEKKEIDRIILLIILTFMLLICRRWYLYWIFAYYVCYFVKIIVFNMKDKNKLKNIVKNWILFVIVALVFFIITLLPLIKNILISNFGSSYEFYMAGGFKTELLSQLKHLGYINFTFILVGMLYGILKKKYGLMTILNIIGYLLMIYMFTRIQNMGLHHSLILLPVYLYFTLLFIEFSLSRTKVISIILITSFIICLFLNFGFGIFLRNGEKIFTDVPLNVKNQKDYKQIGEVSHWLKNNLSTDNSGYMITHNNTYNPDKFRNYYMPDLTISNNLPYGSAIIGVHKFPVELFTAKYIITTTPFETTSIEGKYNDVFNKLISMKKFKLIKDFDMENGYNILIYERIKIVDEFEIDLYLETLKEESEKYPNLYKDVINEYVSSRLLSK